MATKKAKKVVVRKTVAKKAKVTRPTAVSAAHVSEVFTTQPETARTIEVPTGSVALFINGRDKGLVDTHGQKLGAFAVRHADDAGIRSFSLYADGVKLDTGDKDRSLAGISKLEIVTKDARG